jgi:DNA-binding NarL/FixJ family response regulator
MALRLVLAEDSFLIREGLAALLANDPELDLVTSVGSLPELLAAIETIRPDVVLTDIRMPPTGTDEGIRAAEQLATTHPDIGVVVLSQHIEPDYALRLFDGGAQRSRVPAEGARRRPRAAPARHRRGREGRVGPRSSGRRRARRGAPARATSVLDRLTARELEVLELVARGMPRTVRSPTRSCCRTAPWRSTSRAS